MTSISGLGNSWAATQASQTNRHARMQERMFQKTDTDGSGGVDAADLLTQSDANGDGLFGKVDADGSGTLDETEIQTLLDQMSNGSSDSTAATTMLAALDTDDDGSLSQTEFDAGRPQGGGMEAMGGNRPPPPPGGMGGMGGAGGASRTASSSATTTYVPLDTNEDGKVSELERAAADTDASALDKLFSSADADSDGQLSKTELTDFVQQLAEQLTSQYTQVASGNFSNNTGQTVNLLA